MTTLLERSSSRAPGTVDRLLVTLREPVTRQYRPVGFLRRLDRGFQFSYLRSALERPDFRPLPGLSATQGPTLEAEDLFPVFAERVISARRPDRMVSMQALGLTSDAAPFEVLARSHGQRVGDTIELLPAPEAAPGEKVSFPFLTHGVRHLSEEQQNRITELAPGQRLRLLLDERNEVDNHALVVTDEGNVWLGWVPDPLLGVVHSLADCHLEVERANGAEVGFHFRLLVRLDGRAPIHSGLFEGPQWETQQD